MKASLFIHQSQLHFLFKLGWLIFWAELGRFPFGPDPLDPADPDPPPDLDPSRLNPSLDRFLPHFLSVPPVALPDDRDPPPSLPFVPPNAPDAPDEPVPPPLLQPPPVEVNITRFSPSSSSSPLIRSSYAFNLPITSSKPTIFKSKTCSREATMCMNFLGSVFRNFFTSFVSSIDSPSEADLDAKPDNFPAKESIDSTSCIRNLSKSACRVCNRASLTRSAPIWRALIASHSFLQGNILVAQVWPIGKQSSCFDISTKYKRLHGHMAYLLSYLLYNAQAWRFGTCSYELHNQLTNLHMNRMQLCGQVQETENRFPIHPFHRLVLSNDSLVLSVSVSVSVSGPPHLKQTMQKSLYHIFKGFS
ncbi:hypothetical protein LXL04_009686 [Taraxacum kok-saghyz]